jgi:hypothetical protein
MLAIKDLREEIRLGFAVFQEYVRSGGSLNMTSINVHAEDFVKKILNEVYSLSLINANSIAANYPCIDLIDKKERVGVQVTSEKRSRKINNTIKCLENNSDVSSEIDSLKVFILVPKQKSYTINESCPGVSFTWRSDIVDFSSVLKEMVNAESRDTVEDIHSVVTTALPSLYASQRQTLQELRSRLEKNLAIFDREVMRAPHRYEDPVEMYRAIREMRIALQRNSSSRITNEVAAKNFEEAKGVLRSVEYAVRDQFPTVHLAVMNDNTKPQYEGSDHSDAITLMMDIRQQIMPLIDEVKEELERIDNKLAQL